MSGSLRSLATLPSKTPQEVTGVETITPDNIRAVIDYVHRPDPTESEAIYKGNKARQEAFVRTLARQGSAWNEKNIPRVPTEDLKRACEMANVLLKNAAHLSRDEARYIVTIALDLFTPESPDLTADQKANR